MGTHPAPVTITHTHTGTHEAGWSSSPQQVLSLLLQGNMKSKTSEVCLSKWCDLRQTSIPSRLHTPPSENRKQSRRESGGGRKQAEVDDWAAKLDQNWDSATACLQSGSASSELKRIEVRRYEFQKEMWTISFCFIAEGYDGWCCRC